MMEVPKQICYVCDQESQEELITESDGRVHVFFVHKRKGSAGRPRKCDGGYNETESEFMNALEGDEAINTTENAPKIKKNILKLYPRLPLKFLSRCFCTLARNAVMFGLPKNNLLWYAVNVLCVRRIWQNNLFQ